MNSVPKSRLGPEPIATGMLLLGAGLFVLSFIKAGYWVDAFTHPLRTPPDEPPPRTTIDGIGLFVTMLWLAGITWFLGGCVLRSWLRHYGGSDKVLRGHVPHAGLIISALLLVAFLVRLPYLAQGLWYDEIAAFWYYGQHGPGPIVGNMFTPANHVLQSLGSWAMVTLAGGSLDAWLLRFPALVAGLLAAWPVFTLGRRALGEGGAIIATAIILLAPIAVLEGTEARGYALMLFFGAASSALLLAAIEDKRAELLPIYAIACALGAWSHLVTAIIPMGHFLFIVGLLVLVPSQRRFMPLCLGALLLAGVTTVLLLSPVIPDLLAESERFKATATDQPGLLGMQGLDILFGLGGAWSIFGAALGLLLVIVGVVGARDNQRLRHGLLVTGLPIIVALVLVIVLGTWIYARFFIFDLIFVAIAMAGGILVLARFSRALAVVALVLLALSWSVDLLDRWVYPRQPLRELVAEIPDDDSLVASVGILDMPVVIGWYLPNSRTRVVDAGPHVENMADLLADPDVRWVIHSYHASTPFDPSDRWERTWHKRGWIDGNEGTLTLYKRAGD